MVDGVYVYRFPNPPPANGFLGYMWEYGYSLLAIFSLSLLVFFIDRFDIVHAHQPPDTFVFIAGFYKLFGKRYVLDHHDLAPELYFARFRGKGNSIIYRLLLWFERLAFHLADCVISTNNSYKEIAVNRGHVDENRITIVRNGPDLSELRSKDNFEEIQKHGKKIIGYVGVTGIQDGVDNLIVAIYHLVYDLGRNDVLCIIVGSGSAMPMLRSLAKQLEVESYVSFIGWVNEQETVARYLKTMDVCVAPEPSDPYNDRSTAAKVMEYMALGRPIVSSDLPEHCFTAQEAAIYAKPGDGPDLARKISYLIDEPQMRDKMSKAGIRRVEMELAWSHQAKKLITLYETLSSNNCE
jgi:glycosyltransferase involved in cell wall biosynthesis